MATDMPLKVSANAINDADRGTARELLWITDSAVDAIGLNRSRSGFTSRDQRINSSLVKVQAGNAEDVENFSANSQSSTASEILKRSTHASAAFSVPQPVALPPRSDEAARSVRVPVKVLREVPVPHGGRFSGSVATFRDNFEEHVALQRKPDRLINAHQSLLSDATGRKADSKVLQESEKVHVDADGLTVNNARTLRNSSVSGMEASDTTKTNGLPVSNRVHPLMAILDNGYLTQPIHTIVPEERLSTGDSQSTSTSMDTGISASPIEVLAKDKEISGLRFSPELFCSVIIY